MIYREEPIFDGGALWEPQWVSYEDVIKTMEPVAPTKCKAASKYQIGEASKLYQRYCDSFNRMRNNSPWQFWTQCAYEHKDFVINHSLGDIIPSIFEDHRFMDNEVIPCDIVIAWVYDEAMRVEDRYEDYLKYAKQRGIEVQPSLLDDEYSWLRVLNLSRDECWSVICEYADEISRDERREAEERREQEWNRKLEYEQKVKTFIYERQPIPLGVPYEKKELYKRYGCTWVPEIKKWCVTERTWKCYKDPISVFKWLVPEEAEVAIQTGIISETDLTKDARVNYRIYQKKKGR